MAGNTKKDKLLQFFTLSCVNNAFWAALLLNRPLLDSLVSTVPKAAGLFLLVALCGKCIAVIR